ncbi:MAG: NADH:ubiquinone reductase (Na(+)-transporting) subunit D [Spirochaetes bacterium GWD1_61_31]|nr:MAG: NADH:ubiquinone reductase (Na(+)-transporting) subunit D [Spirochaetes bacterium GWB1_60_80]OHD34288.1 MAG: NADH:ubiquinone reductase (Na(+)-transporting) subunit D [Spirochaetes bacterium GWC1_61_12]OHD40216.1 MAG: NADH:ubiquinone reductase (Na(+)-transporting) subunit D [Spirochaetes bacterium GWD1_61_31]OHD45736.1 MAG: NADH:ubiquinone reductase (Na(+)-transporting) subunit D [Spirochaetes bacterium GWE1_60_18]OHD58281.1 MAG: NADH:ubiquinone reductase (Na(+)-transporting) subunit D [S
MKNSPALANLKENIWTNNPIFVQILGICSTLAVTNSMRNTFIMTFGVMMTTALSSFTLSAIKQLIPRKVRMIVQVLVISFYVIIIDIILRAWLPEVSRQLGPYVGLIITNCIIMGRAEAYAQANKPLASFWDGLTSGLGYMLVLMTLAVVRELLGFGSLFDFRILPAGFVSWTIMIMAPSAFFLVAILMWLAKTIQSKPARKEKT